MARKKRKRGRGGIRRVQPNSRPNSQATTNQIDLPRKRQKLLSEIDKSLSETRHLIETDPSGQRLQNVLQKTRKLGQAVADQDFLDLCKDMQKMGLFERLKENIQFILRKTDFLETLPQRFSSSPNYKTVHDFILFFHQGNHESIAEASHTITASEHIENLLFSFEKKSLENILKLLSEIKENREFHEDFLSFKPWGVPSFLFLPLTLKEESIFYALLNVYESLGANIFNLVNQRQADLSDRSLLAKSIFIRSPLCIITELLACGANPLAEEEVDGISYPLPQLCLFDGEIFYFEAYLKIVEKERKAAWLNNFKILDKNGDVSEGNLLHFSTRRNKPYDHEITSWAIKHFPELLLQKGDQRETTPLASLADSGEASLFERSWIALAHKKFEETLAKNNDRGLLLIDTMGEKLSFELFYQNLSSSSDDSLKVKIFQDVVPYDAFINNFFEASVFSSYLFLRSKALKSYLPFIRQVASWSPHLIKQICCTGESTLFIFIVRGSFEVANLFIEIIQEDAFEIIKNHTPNLRIEDLLIADENSRYQTPFHDTYKHNYFLIAPNKKKLSTSNREISFQKICQEYAKYININCDREKNPIQPILFEIIEAEDLNNFNFLHKKIKTVDWHIHYRGEQPIDLLMKNNSHKILEMRALFFSDYLLKAQLIQEEENIFLELTFQGKEEAYCRSHIFSTGTHSSIDKFNKINKLLAKVNSTFISKCLVIQDYDKFFHTITDFHERLLLPKSHLFFEGNNPGSQTTRRITKKKAEKIKAGRASNEETSSEGSSEESESPYFSWFDGLITTEMSCVECIGENSYIWVDIPCIQEQVESDKRLDPKLVEVLHNFDRKELKQLHFRINRTYDFGDVIWSSDGSKAIEMKHSSTPHRIISDGANLSDFCDQQTKASLILFAEATQHIDAKGKVSKTLRESNKHISLFLPECEGELLTF